MTADSIRASQPQRLRILHVILSRGFAGSERAAAEACNALAVDHDVALLIRRDHAGPNGASVLDVLDPGVEVIEVPPWARTRHHIGAAIEAWRPDVIHTHLRRGTRLVVQLAKGIPQVSTLHLSINGPHYLAVEALVCISEWQLEQVPADYAGRVFLIPNSLVPNPRLAPDRVRELRGELGARDDEFVIGAVGRLVDRKGFDLLIRAFEQARLPDGRLVIVGDGRARDRLEGMAGERVRFAGFRSDVKDLYQAFDLFVCPSTFEPFGRVIVEALDAGTPVIATDAEGPRDLARRYPISIVPRSDVGALANALERAAASPRRRLDVDLSEFGAEPTTAGLVAVYHEVLAARRAGRTGAVPPVPVARSGAGFPPRFLFSPVSGPGGSGELMRCLIIARELARAEPAADIRFMVSRKAVFREAVDFPIIDCDASPTNSTPQVLAAVDAFRPHVMVFDNSGRTAQLRAAKRAGARLVFSSRAPKLRWKAFRLKWMRLLDEHWIVFPTFVTGERTWLEAFKMRFFPDYRVRQFDTLFTPSDSVARDAWLADRNLRPGDYVVFAPGGRGEGHMVADPAELFIAAARLFAAETGCTCVVLTGRNAVPPIDVPAVRLLPRIGPGEVQHLLADARIVVSNGGTTLLHTLAHGRPLVAVPLAGDQDRRIRRAAKLQIAVSASRDPVEIAEAAASLLRDEGRQQAMVQRIARMGIRNGVVEAVASLRSLAGRSLA